MAILSYVGAEINPANNTFETWLNRTNDIIGDMGTVVVTIDGTNTGNTHLNGTFSADTIFTGTELRGGDANGGANFTVSSNVEFTADSATVSQNTIFTASGNVVFNGATSDFTVSTIETNITSANTNISGYLIQSGDAEFTGNTEFVGEVTFSNDLTLTAPLTTNSSITVSGEINSTGTLNSTGVLVANGDVTINGDLTAIANVEFTGTVDVTGPITITGNTELGGDVTFTTDTLVIPTGNTAGRPGTPSAGMLRFNSELEEFEGYDGTNWGLIGGGGTGNPTIITSNHSAVEGEFLFVNTSANTYTITLPSSPDSGDIIKVAGKNWSVNSVLINRNGETIEGFADDLELDIEDSSVEFIYDGSTWQVFTNVVSTAGGGSGLGEPIIVAANYGASSGQFIYADCSNSSFTVTLPATPNIGDIVKLVGANWAVNNLTVARNGETIEDTAEDLTVDVDDVTLELIYDGSTWQVFANIGGGATIGVIDATGNTEYNITMTTEVANGVFTTVSVDTGFTFNPDTGAVTATDFNSLSDVAAKDNISSISNVVETLMNLNPVEFTWKKNGNKSYGVIAQELENVLPELVTQGKDNKYVNYIPLIALLLEGYKDLVKKIESLENK